MEKKDLKRFFKYTKKAAQGCWFWTASRTRQGYGRFSIRSKEIFAHRAIYEHFNGPVEPSFVVMHSCDVPSCVNPEHLRVGTYQDNSTDMKNKGRQTRGTACHKAKLDENKVKEIRRLKRLGLSHRTLAKSFGVSTATIKDIYQRRSWAWLT